MMKKTLFLLIVLFAALLLVSCNAVDGNMNSVELVLPTSFFDEEVHNSVTKGLSDLYPSNSPFKHIENQLDKGDPMREWKAFSYSATLMQAIPIVPNLKKTSVSFNKEIEANNISPTKAMGFTLIPHDISYKDESEYLIRYYIYEKHTPFGFVDYYYHKDPQGKEHFSLREYLVMTARIPMGDSYASQNFVFSLILDDIEVTSDDKGHFTYYTGATQDGINFKKDAQVEAFYLGDNLRNNFNNGYYLLERHNVIMKSSSEEIAVTYSPNKQQGQTIEKLWSDAKGSELYSVFSDATNGTCYIDSYLEQPNTSADDFDIEFLFNMISAMYQNGKTIIDFDSIATMSYKRFVSDSKPKGGFADDLYSNTPKNNDANLDFFEYYNFTTQKAAGLCFASNEANHSIIVLGENNTTPESQYKKAGYEEIYGKLPSSGIDKTNPKDVAKYLISKHLENCNVSQDCINTAVWQYLEGKF